MTFSPGPFLPSIAATAVGPTLLYRADGELLVVPRDGSAPLHAVTPIPFFHERGLALLTDQKDNVILLTLGSGSPGQVEAHRLNAGESTFAPAKALGPTVGFPSAVPLSDGAIAFMLFGNGTASVAVETWP